MTKAEREFLNEFNISDKVIKSSGTDVKDLVRINSDFNLFKKDLELPTEYLTKVLIGMEGVHSVSSRIKDTQRLLLKIVRKKIEDNNSIINTTNYRTKITDLIATRALHLLKEDWFIIHNGIINNYDLFETPKAYYREGDDVKMFKNEKIDPIPHESGYRSVHYLVKIPSGKQEFIGEIQVRTIFEEAWGQLDHILKYSKPNVDESIDDLLRILNRICGSADEMCSFIYNLNNKLQKAISKS